jgi:outer membrane protein assembly factor BamB
MRILVTTLACAALSAQSPMFRGDAARTGVYPATAKPIQGAVAWSTPVMDGASYKALQGALGQAIWPTTPAVVGDRLYTCAGPLFSALDLAGKVLYRTRLGGFSLSSPALAGGKAYVPADDGLLYALDPADGRILWTFRIAAPSRLKMADAWDVYHSSPAVADGRVYVGGADGAVFAVDAKDGREIWRRDTGDVVRASPAVAGGRVYVGTFGGKVHCLDAVTGTEDWVGDTHLPGVPWHAIQGSCAVSGGVVTVGSRSTCTFAFEARTGKLLWKHSHKGSWVPSSPAVRDGIAYIGQSDGNKVTALNPDGTVKWEVDAGAPTFASPALSGDVLYVATNDNYDLNGKGGLRALDARDGRTLWTCPLPGSVWSSPVVAGDAVYVGCADGKVYAIR